ncbi:MAG: hypothetical protein JO228_03610, partial [Xanthobacteraceae bacterium]|nr:hypothetical protein [Xanthobacteraceae bacterium]
MSEPVKKTAAGDPAHNPHLRVDLTKDSRKRLANSDVEQYLAAKEKV